MNPTPSPFAPAARRAFTLIELLTVIAIIGILAAIIIPVVGKVRQTARESQGLSNLRQIGLASISFAMENRGQFPSHKLARAQSPALDHWARLLRSHIGGTDASFGAVLTDPSSGVAGPNLAVQFVPNNYVAPLQGQEGQFFKVYSLDRIRNPSQVIFAADGVLDPTNGFATQDISNLGGQTGALWGMPVGSWVPESNPERANDPIGTSDVLTQAGGGSDIAYRAQGNSAAKVVFLDGHAKMMKKGTILARNIQPGF